MPSTDFHPDLGRTARIAPRTLITPRTLPLMRALMKLQSRRTPPDVEVFTLIDGTGIQVYRPVDGADVTPALLRIHGGGYVMGAAQQDDKLCRRFSSELDITVASVEYRLASEHPYPAALEDCYSALRWLAATPAKISPDCRRRGSGWAPAICSMTRTSRTPSDSETPACPARSKWCRAHSTVSTT